MPRGSRLVPVGLAAILSLCLPRGGACDGAPPLRAGSDSEPRTGLSVSAGGAWTTVHLFGGVHDAGRRTMILEVQRIRNIKLSENLAFDYRMGFVPVEMQTTRLEATLSGTGLAIPLGRATIFGAGLDPVGVGVLSRRGNWRPFGAVRGGVRYFQAPVPDPRGSRLNFAATLGVGVLRRIGRSQWLSVSVDLHHVSNAGLTDSNPGINQLVLNIGCLSMR